MPGSGQDIGSMSLLTVYSFSTLAWPRLESLASVGCVTIQSPHLGFIWNRICTGGSGVIVPRMKSLNSINVLSLKTPGTRCWVLDDGRPGHFHQSLALVRALGLQSCPERISLPRALPRARQLTANSGHGLLIACGGRSANCSKEIKKMQPAFWTNIQILNPRVSLSGLDWVLAPHHDGLSGSQVIDFLGALTEIDQQFLDNARARFPRFGQLGNPRIVMLVGGPGRRARWRQADLKRWLVQLHEQARQQGGTAMLLNSRRTPGWATTMMKQCATRNSHFYSHDGDENPYAGILAFADRFWVTGDSVNMLAEACSTSRPVRLLGGERLGGRIRTHCQQLKQRQRLLDDWKTASSGKFEPLQEARRVALVLRRRGALLGFEQAVPKITDETHMRFQQADIP